MSSGYALLDSGEGEKLERFGAYVLARPDPAALWEKKNPIIWKSADAQFVRKGTHGSWVGRELPKEWELSYAGFTFLIRPTSFKHTGLFPEQKNNWEWIQKTLTADTRVLNLFAYTGGATLAALSLGADVTHVDASKTANVWAAENVKRSGFAAARVWFITDDVMAFVKREIRREARYDAVILDPPAFGRGAKGEVWKIERDFLPLIALLKKLVPEPRAIVVNGYAAGYSHLAFQYALAPLVSTHIIESGELIIPEEEGNRFLPAGIFARWHRDLQ